MVRSRLPASPVNAMPSGAVSVHDDPTRSKPSHPLRSKVSHHLTSFSCGQEKGTGSSSSSFIGRPRCCIVGSKPSVATTSAC